MYRDWKAESWFTLRVESEPAADCQICFLPLKIEDTAYLVFEEDLLDAHVSCADSLVRCAGSWSGGVWRQCKACEGRGYGSSSIPCRNLPPS